jgi:Flp pilus assembly protein TadG
MIIVAIVGTVILGFTALTVDVGRAYSERQQLQRTADAAAVSGAQGFAQPGTAAVKEAAAFNLAKTYELANTRPAVDGPVYHPSGYTGDPNNSNPGNCYSVVSPNPLALTDCISAQTAGCPVTVGGASQNFDCVQARIVSPQFPWMFAGLLGAQPRALSARSVAIVGTGAPGGATLMPWLLLDCPDSDGSRGYADEQTAGLVAAANLVHPSQPCPYQYVYGSTGTEAATYSALTSVPAVAPPPQSAGALFNLFLDSGTGGNFQGAQLGPSPCVAKVDGYFAKTQGANDYKDGVAGNPNECFVGAGGRLYSKTGNLGNVTSTSLDTRGVASCLGNPAEFASAIQFRGDGVVDIKHLNPCIMALTLVVHLRHSLTGSGDPPMITPPNDVHGTHSKIVSWQDEAWDGKDAGNPNPGLCNPLDNNPPAPCDGNWRFAPVSHGTSDPLLVRRIAFFYLTKMADKSNGNYSGLLLRVFDSNSALVGPGDPSDGDLVVKLVCVNGAC